MVSRRQFLSITGTGVVVAVAGCAEPPTNEGTSAPTPPPTGVETPPPEETPVDEEIDIQNPEVGSDAELVEWDAELDCHNGSTEDYHAQMSEISVVAVEDSVGDEFKPVAYDSLTDDQKLIISQVLVNGGFATCETWDAFNSFLDVAINEHSRKQEGDDMTVYLEYDGRYYQLYIQKQDQVYAY